MSLFRLLKIMGGYVIPYLTGIVFMTISVRLFGVIKSFLVKDVFDMLSGNGESLIGIVIKNMIAGGVCLAVYIFTSYMYKVESKRGHKILRYKVFKKILKLPMKYFEEHQSGDIISSFFYDTSQAADIYTAKLRRFSAPLISVFVYLIPMLMLNAPLTVCLVSANICALVLNRHFSVKVKGIRLKMSEKNARMTEQLNNIIWGIAEIKAFGIGRRVCAGYCEFSGDYYNCECENGKIISEAEAVNVFFDFLCSLVFLLAGIIFVSKELATISALAAVYTMYSDFSSQFLLMCKYFPDLMGCLASADKVFKLMEEKEEDEPKVLNKINSEYAVEFKNIDFGYGGRRVLENFSMKAEKGISTAIVGESGRGKSTLAKLLMRFYLPENGEIYVNGEIKENRQLREMISYVPQEPYIFNVSLMENIRYGNTKASDEDVIKAAKLANAHEFIIQKENGYKTNAGERGNRLSGGERQRIAIARAILKDAPIILLDEATAALDNENERKVVQGIKALAQNKTLIMIAHRPSAIKSADRVVKI